MADAVTETRSEARARYRSLFTYADDDPGSEARLAAAIELARREDAHLSVVAFGYDPSIPPYGLGDGIGPVVETVLKRVRAGAKERARPVRAAMDREGVRGDVSVEVVTYGTLPAAVAAHARFADLVVVGRPYGETAPGAAADALEGALFEGDAAVFVCPPEATLPDGGTVVIGWDDSREALRAVRRAMPMLQRAASVEIVMIDPSSDTLAPGEELATMLSRHDVAVEIVALPAPSGTRADALVRHARETGADLLVLGAYGHSRFREAVIGGVTRDTLERTEVAVLMAH